ncbi:uncharacterized protein LAESUDRAFT_744336 [Laetiporus sulphureus 93-53]|uniref:Exoribonuclease phosphorolytic domain-containing protein n=1 Tax=Laetiporus sulphureus 93-53 TaxID=1314785 RepID=A0A165DCD2_9APHY|nr:uncharacterized protein LAESUDRAFT_744336 [Laetiporus sulphureus 93-53]KZT04551.1 hypothetical protein LAESUDRAFT_744336 [Laetiporus sulphureus 93-53]
MSLRTDGRAVDELRTISIAYEGLDRVDGSARFGFGETKSLTSVSGPIEVRPNFELPSQATLDIHIRPLASISGTDSKAISATLKSILMPALFLTHYPRTLVQLVGQALCGTESGSGMGSVGKGWYASLVASLINASSAALINAGSVSMKGVVCAVSVGRLPSASGTTLVLDPSESELSRLSGGGCFAFLFSSVLPVASIDELPPCSLLWTNYTTHTPFDDSELAHAKELAEKGARRVWMSLKESVGRMEASATSVEDVKLKSGSSKMDTNAGMPAGEENESDVDDEKMEI